MVQGPFKPIFSFRILKLNFEKLLNSKNPSEQFQSKQVLDILEAHPQLVKGTDSVEEFYSLKGEIAQIMSYLFPSVLTHNEIRAALYPFTNTFFFTTNRLREIAAASISDLNETLKNLYQYSEDSIDLLPYVFILNLYYGYKIDFAIPKQISLKNHDGSTRTYRATINADFIDIYPNENYIDITPEIVKELLTSTDDMHVWQRYFPANSWTIEGFSMINMIDTTLDEQINQFKTDLISPIENSIEKINNDYRKIFNIPDLQVGSFRVKDDIIPPIYDPRLKTITLEFDTQIKTKEYACDTIYQSLFINHKITLIPSVSKYHKETAGNHLSNILTKKKLQSIVLVPIVIQNKLEYILELAAYNTSQLNAVNITKIDSLLPFILSHAKRSLSEYENQIRAIIQNQCTTIHPSVEWRFIEEAVEYLQNKNLHKIPVFKEVVFDRVLPLFGQIDIVASSKARNKAIKQDLIQQLTHAEQIFKEHNLTKNIQNHQKYLIKIKKLLLEVELHFNNNTEQKTHEYFRKKIIPVFNDLHHNGFKNKSLDSFFKLLDPSNFSFYIQRKNYDDTVNTINKKLAAYIEKQQIEAQKYFPHYFQIFKTDGVEHNIYVGQSISKHKIYNPSVIHYLRFWQLKTMCEMENSFYKDKENHLVKLHVASLILAYDVPLNIRYRIDEKQFDVDGAYNMKYEMIKKRIDKVHIKNTTERLTQPHKLAVVYSSSQIESEYLEYFRLLKSNHFIKGPIEQLELEELQGTGGIKALRATINQDLIHRY